MVKIIVDSTCDIPAEWKEHYEVETLPLVVTLDGKDYKDGVEIQIDTLYKYMREGVFPKTSQVPPELIYEAFEAHLQRGEDFIYLAFSSELSGTCQLAVMVANELREKYPNRRMAVVDSKGGSLATGLIASRAYELAAQGASFEELIEEMNRMIGRVEHLFTISSLEWLAKGGRISKPLGYAGDVLNIKPILDVENGKMVVIKMVRGRKKALKYLVSKIVERAQNYPDQVIALAHADDLETVETLQDMIHEFLPECRTVICEIGCVLGTHLGIGGVGAFFFR